MNFLPDDYEAPKSNSSYFKLEDGENKVRILSSPIIGWEDWKDKKPIRFRLNAKPDKPVEADKPIKHFWAFIVWDYREEKIKIFEVTQASIRKRIEALSKDSDWGAPYGYDIKIKKSGQQKNTEYEINPSPHKDVDARVREAFNETPIDLEEMYRGGDPFAAVGGYRTKGFWEIQQPLSEAKKDNGNDVITQNQVSEIEGEIEFNISGKDKGWRQKALDGFRITSFSQLPKKYFDLMKKRIEEKKDLILEQEVPF